jgi:hypothetical protein
MNESEIVTTSENLWLSFPNIFAEKGMQE